MHVRNVTQLKSVKAFLPRSGEEIRLGELNHPTGAEALFDLGSIAARLKQAAEKHLTSREGEEKHPSAAKAGGNFAGFSGTTKVVPFQNSGCVRVFPQPVKPCPFKTSDVPASRIVPCYRSLRAQCVMP